MAPSQPSPGLLSSPRMEIWPDFIQPKVTPAPLPYRTLLISDQQGSGWKERLTAFISQSSVVVCSLQPFTYKEFPAGEGRYLLTACSGKQRSPATRSGSAAKDKWPCPESINKPKIIQLTLRLFSKLIRPPCWKEREGIREEPDLYLEINALKFTQVLVNNTVLFENRYFKSCRRRRYRNR